MNHHIHHLNTVYLIKVGKNILWYMISKAYISEDSKTGTFYFKSE